MWGKFAVRVSDVRSVRRMCENLWMLWLLLEVCSLILWWWKWKISDWIISGNIIFASVFSFSVKKRWWRREDCWCPYRRNIFAVWTRSVGRAGHLCSSTVFQFNADLSHVLSLFKQNWSFCDLIMLGCLKNWPSANEFGMWIKKGGVCLVRFVSTAPQKAKIKSVTAGLNRSVLMIFISRGQIWKFSMTLSMAAPVVV